MFSKILTTTFVLVVAIAISMYANVARAQIVTNGLVSYWDFNRVTGNTVEDVWGNNEGTIIGSPKTVAGRIGNALEFNGSSDCVDCGNDKSLNFDRNDSFSFCAWIKPNEILGYQAIVAKMDSAWKGYVFFISGTDEPNNPAALGTVLSNTNVANDLVCYTPSNSMTTDWNFVCITFAGTSNIAGTKFYLNGKNQEISTVRDGLTDTMLTTPSLKIGREDVDSFPMWFGGIIDEVSVYNRALSEAEVLQNFTAEGVAAVGPANKLSLTWGAIKI